MKSSLGPTLAYGVFDALGAAILGGRYEGRKLPNTLELTVDYGVSLGVVREAVKMLQAKGLVRTSPCRGMYLAPEEDWNLLDRDVVEWLAKVRPASWVIERLNDVRMAFLPEAAALAASRATSSERIHLVGLAQQMSRRFYADGAEPPTATTVQLAVLRASHNQFLNGLSHIATCSASVIGRASPVHPDLELVASVRGLGTAIGSREPGGARSWMRCILEREIAIFRSAAG